jgi:alkylation response protein AidB-like acyl-CoA dehydrogenase
VNFDLDDNQALFQATVERFVSSEDVPSRHRTRRMTNGFDRARWRELAELGLIAIAAKEADGGLGGSLSDCAVVAQALGKGVSVSPWLECGFLPARLLDGTGHATGVVEGGTLAALALAERRGRFQLAAQAVTAKRNGDICDLSGEKQFVLGGAIADIFIVTADLDGATELFIVERELADLKSYPVADGSLASVATFRAAAATQLPGGMARLEAAVLDTMLMASAEMVGLAQRLFDETLSYVKTREQFGQPIGRFQVIQHRMVDAYARVEEIQSALYRALLVPEKDRWAVLSGLKAQVGEAALAIAHDAVQFHGGMGMTDELIVSHGLKRILLLSKLFGDPATGFATFAKAA